ncbi:MAG: hydrogenase expression/formation protein HypE [Pseudomonadota bacterium]
MTSRSRRSSAPVLRDDRITLAHGGGGKAMQALIGSVFVPAFDPPGMEDQARLSAEALSRPGAALAFTTDSFVVTPLEFPGGNIGSLAVCGTINDLAVGGAQPLWLSASFIIEEGFDVERLRRIVGTMASEARQAGVRIVTGDTKVVERGSADGLYITTSGLGVIEAGRALSSDRIEPGDIAIASGVLGDHGATILAARGDLALSAPIESDCRSLSGLMQAVLRAAPGVRAARDATRGGVASALNEMAEAAAVSVEIDENRLPVRAEVKGMCEILGLDPLYLANEGTLVLFVPEAEAEAALAAMRDTEAGREAVVIGRAIEQGPVPVTMTTVFGGQRIVDMLVGDQLPRIC